MGDGIYRQSLCTNSYYRLVLGIDREKLRELPTLSAQEPHDKGSPSNRMAWMGPEKRVSTTHGSKCAPKRLHSTEENGIARVLQHFDSLVLEKSSVHSLLIEVFRRSSEALHAWNYGIVEKYEKDQTVESIRTSGVDVSRFNRTNLVSANST